MAKDTGEIHVDDIGTILKVTLKENDVPVDVSTATLKEITIVTSAGVKTTYTADFSTDGTDGNIQYITAAGNLPVPGEYHIQAEIQMPSWSGKSNIGTFPVVDNL